jgi:hypothetical protein
MPYPLRYRAEAEAEIMGAYLWFEEQLADNICRHTRRRPIDEVFQACIATTRWPTGRRRARASQAGSGFWRRQ